MIGFISIENQGYWEHHGLQICIQPNAMTDTALVWVTSVDKVKNNRGHVEMELGMELQSIPRRKWACLGFLVRTCSLKKIFLNPL